MQVCHNLSLCRLPSRGMRGHRKRRCQRVLFPRHAQHWSLSVLIEMPLLPLRRDWIHICLLQAIDDPCGRRVKTHIYRYWQGIPNNCIPLVTAFGHVFLRPSDYHPATPTQNTFSWCCLVVAWLLLGCPLLLFGCVPVAFGVPPLTRGLLFRVPSVTFLGVLGVSPSTRGCFLGCLLLLFGVSLLL